MYKNSCWKKFFSMIMISIFISFSSFANSYSFYQNFGFAYGTNNIALNKATSSDGMNFAYGPYCGNDNKLNTYWSAKDSNPNHWWMVDLNYLYSLSGFEVVWKEDNVLYKYKIEVSTDKMNWDTVVDRTNNTLYTQTQSDSFNATARYVRITITGVQSGHLPSFYEFRVFGTFISKPTAEIFTPTTTPTPTPTTPTFTATPTPVVTAASTVLPTPQSVVSVSRNTLDTVNYGSVSNISLSQSGDILIPGTIREQKEIILVIENSLASNTVCNDLTTALDYGLFAKNDIFSIGEGTKIYASVNANNNFISYVDTLDIRDVLSAGDFSITTPNMNVNWYINNIKPIEMPVFYEELIEEAEANSMVFKPSDFAASNVMQLPGQPNFLITYNYGTNTFLITGSGKLKIESSMYFQGNVKISVPQTENMNRSFLLADGSIEIQGAGLSPSSTTDILNLYSIYGCIRISTYSSTIRGIMYASGITGNPLYTDHVGDIIIEGSNNTILGAVVSGNDIIMYGANTTVEYPYEGFSHERSQYYDSRINTFDFREIAKMFVDGFADTETKMGVIQYCDSANDNSFLLYDLSDPDEVSDLKNEIENMEINNTEQSNMGDGLRRAYHTLNNLPTSDASKYIVNISVAAPNKWTSENDTYSEYKTDNESADYISGDGTYDADEKGLDYAKSIGSIISSSNMEAIFIDYSDISSVTSKLEDISVSAGAKALSTGVHYYTIPSIHDFSSIISGISKKPPANITLNNVLYEEKYPLGVRVAKVPSGMTITQETKDGNTRYKVSGILNNIKLTYDGSKYIIDPYSFDIAVKYVLIGEVNYSGSDSKFTYTIDYVDTNGYDRTMILEKSFDDMSVNVRWTIDIQ